MLREALMAKYGQEADYEEGVLESVVDFLIENPNPSDDQVHAFAETHGIDPDDLEPMFYMLATIAAKFINGGRAAEKNLDYDDVDPDQLRKGIEVEKEHIDDEDVASRIALDHLAEFPDYYTRLEAMENEAKAAHGKD